MLDIRNKTTLSKALLPPLPSPSASEINNQLELNLITSEHTDTESIVSVTNLASGISRLVIDTVINSPDKQQLPPPV